MLSVRDLVVAYGKKQVLHGVDLDVSAGQIVALVGHNGAGKTTLLRSIVGLESRVSGSVAFLGDSVPEGKVAASVRRGIAFVPQGQNTFRSMSVAENLAIPMAEAGTDGSERLAIVEEMFPILRERRQAVASTLSGGQQQMLALGIALLRGPRLIILDEPSTGLAPVLVDEVFTRVMEMRDRLGMSVLVVDQNVRRLIAFADHVTVLKAGSVALDGTPASIGDDERLWSLF